MRDVVGGGAAPARAPRLTTLVLTALAAAAAGMTAGPGCSIDQGGLGNYKPRSDGAAAREGGAADAGDGDLAGDLAGDPAGDLALEGAPDGAADLGDGDADAACAPCDDGVTLVAAPGGRFTGTTAGGSASAGSCGGGDAPEAVYKLVLTEASDVFVTTHGTGFDTVVYMRAGCCGAEIACSDDADGRTTSRLSARGLAAGSYYIVVDGATSDDAGDFTIDIYASPAAAVPGDTCGNPARIADRAISSTTCGARDDYNPQPGCVAAPDGTSGIDQVYYFVLDAPSTVTFDTCSNTCIDSVLNVRDVCSEPSSQLACDDDSCGSGGSCFLAANLVQSRVSVNLEAGAHYLVVDTFPASAVACGAVTITPSGVPP